MDPIATAAELEANAAGFRNEHARLRSSTMTPETWAFWIDPTSTREETPTLRQSRPSDLRHPDSPARTCWR